jgi:RNA polymerase sigma-70 factor (ECF subfamily)
LEELAQRVRAGDKAAACEFSERHKPALGRFVGRLLDRNDGRVQDIVQETFISFWEKTGCFKDGSLRALLFRIALNKANSQRRRDCVERHGKDRLEQNSEASKGDDSVPTVNDAINKDLFEVLQLALSKLPEKQQRAVKLHCCDGLTVKETASTLGVCERTIRRWISRVRGKLRLMLGEGEE